MAQRANSKEQVEYAPVDLDLSGFLGYNLKRVLSLIQSDLGQVLVPFDLRAVSFSALCIVVRNPGINQTRLADALKIERSNLVQLIDDLAARNLLLRAPVVGDRRQYALMATKSGTSLCAEAELAVADHERRVFSMLSDAERDGLLDMLKKIRDNWGA